MNVSPFVCDKAPSIPDLETAHLVIVRHQDCGAECLPSQAALKKLVDEGQYVLASQFDNAPTSEGQS